MNANTPVRQDVRYNYERFVSESFRMSKESVSELFDGVLTVFDGHYQPSSNIMLASSSTAQNASDLFDEIVKDISVKVPYHILKGVLVILLGGVAVYFLAPVMGVMLAALLVALLVLLIYKSEVIDKITEVYEEILGKVGQLIEGF